MWVSRYKITAQIYLIFKFGHFNICTYACYKILQMKMKISLVRWSKNCFICRQQILKYSQSLISKDIYWIYKNLYANICFISNKICYISIWANQLDYHRCYSFLDTATVASYGASSTDPTCKQTLQLTAKNWNSTHTHAQQHSQLKYCTQNSWNSSNVHRHKWLPMNTGLESWEA